MKDALISPVFIANTIIAPDTPIFIIAEVGVNHNGDLQTALDCVRAAKRSGADCVKFQTFAADRVATRNAPKARYQLGSIRESQFEMLRKLELSFENYERILELCAEENIVFLSTPYSNEDVEFLETLDVPAYKIASGQVVELSFLEHVSRKHKPVILSTGMATLSEIGQAVKAVRKIGNSQLLLLQCTTSYPAPVSKANVRAMETMRKQFHVHCGYSDHTQSPTSAIVAVSLGARVIEKHFTLDKSMHGPDHSSSAEPEEFEGYVRMIREAEQALGTGLKQPADIEIENLIEMRRSIVAREFIPANSQIDKAKVTFKRPATGINPAELGKVLRCRAKRNIMEDEILTWEMLLR